MHYAGFWIRLIADLIDSFILDLASVLVLLMFLGIVYWVGTLRGAESPIFSNTGFFDPVFLQVSLVSLRLIFSVLYYTWMTFKYGATFGKMPFKIRVVNASDGSAITLKQSLNRCFGYTLSYLVLGGGFWMAAFRPRKQGLHDLLAGTVSIRES